MIADVNRGDAVAVSAGGDPPALLTSTSSRPVRSTIAATSASTCSGSRTSAVTKTASRPPARGSSSGVVLPTFLPIVPGLIEKLGGGNPLMIAYSINVGSHLVDVSPLSTLGALCLAVAAPEEDRPALFRKLMAWGWSMSLVGAIVCQLFFGYR